MTKWQTNGIYHEDIIEDYLSNNLRMDILYDKYTTLSSSQLWDIVQEYIDEMDEILPIKRMFPTCR